jgi:small-conductance mechanosensitive channel
VFIKRNLDRSLATFILSLISIVLYFILIVTVIGILGVETSSFLALFASAGVAVGLALSGTLQNFAGGVLILLLKPYKIGDYIEAQGFAGTVKEIQIFSTVINTPDNKQIIIPNGPLSTGSINNYSKEQYRRIDWTVSIAYGDDFDVARDAILKILNSDERVVKGMIDDSLASQFADVMPHQADDDAEQGKRSWLSRIFSVKSAPQALSRKIEEQHARIVAMLPKTDGTPRVFLASLGASSVDITVRAWAQAADYWAVYFEMNRRFYKELPTYGLHFPFPQMDVHVTNE